MCVRAHVHMRVCVCVRMCVSKILKRVHDDIELWLFRWNSSGQCTVIWFILETWQVTAIIISSKKASGPCGRLELRSLWLINVYIDMCTHTHTHARTHTHTHACTQSCTGIHRLNVTALGSLDIFYVVVYRTPKLIWDFHVHLQTEIFL